MNSLYIWKQNEDMVLWIILEYVTVDPFEHFKRYNMPFAILKQKKWKETGKRCNMNCGWVGYSFHGEIVTCSCILLIHIVDLMTINISIWWSLKDVAFCRVLIQFQSFYHGLRRWCILQNGSYEYSFHQLHLPSRFCKKLLCPEILFWDRVVLEEHLFKVLWHIQSHFSKVFNYILDMLTHILDPNVP